MSSGKEMYLSILVSAPMLLICVAIALATIVLLKKGKRYNKFARGSMIALLFVTFGIAVYLVYLAFAFGNSHPSALHVPLQ